ncbi:MAG: polyisoprenoid-binding protein [Flavobacteriales bacterium]|nr:MAG: polyisoprenoid-binding protein [Flavobacteriales bacterium]
MGKLILVSILMIGATLSAQSTWKADKAHSSINFSITHLMISEVQGKFADFDIKATANEAFDSPSFKVSIQTTSVDTDNARRDDDLRSDRFFEVAAYPTMTFTTTSYEKTGDKTFILKGDLNLHGVTKPVVLEGKLNGIITDQRSQKLKAGLKLTGTLNRQDFNVGADRAPVGDEVAMTINLEMAQQ